MPNGTEQQGAAGGPPPITLSLYVRTPVAGERTVTIDRLTALNVADAVADVEITTVRDEIILAEAGERRAADDVHRAFASFLEWAAGEITPALDVRRTSTRTGRSVRTVSTPGMTLAIYERGELACVYPCTSGDRTWTVAAFLERFETDRALPPDDGPALSAY